MLQDVIVIAKEAGEIIRDGFKKNFSIELKTGENNIVTEIDKKAEKTIIDFVNKKYPGHSILAEESGATDKGNEYLWVIDPLDGTTNFAHGLPIFSVSIGLQKNGQTICGVIYDVMRDKLFACEKGSGSFCNDEKIYVSNNDNLQKSLLVTGFPYEQAERIDSAVELFKAFLSKSRAVRRLGSAAIDLCFVAEGVFDGFWEEKLNPWDVCAGMLLVEEAGGKISDFNGRFTDIYSKQMLATNGKIEKQMLEIINN